MGTKLDPGSFDCYHAAANDEPMFVLLARDPVAPAMVRKWARKRMKRLMRAHAHSTTAIGWRNRELDKICEAYACAAAMEAWQRRDNNG